MVRSFARSLAGLLTACAVFVGCDQPEAVDPGANTDAPRFFVSITPDHDSLDIGATLPLTASVVDALGTPRGDQAVQWSSLSPEIASIDGVGIVTGVAVGTASIVARVGSGAQIHADTATLRVRERVVALTITPELAEITLGDSLQLEAMMSTPSGASVRGVSVAWTTSDQNVAPISEDGVVTSLSEGDVTFTAVVNGVTATALARILPNPAVSISVSPANSGLNPGETVQLAAIVRDSRGRIKRLTDVRWSSSAPAIASVSMTGLVTGRVKGAALITATAENRRASATVNVFAIPAMGVVVTAPSNTVPQGGRLKATATVRDAEGQLLSEKTIAWSSSNPSVAQIGADGTITGLIVGNTTIHAIVDSKVGSLPISVVSAAASSLTVLPATASVSLGKTAQLTAELRDQAGNLMTGGAVTWTSANASVATVNSAGVVNAIGVGTAAITARSGLLSATSTVSVIPSGVTSVSVSPTVAQLQVGATQQLSATVTMAGGTPVANAAVTWSSSNPTIVTITANGVATAVSPGNVTITATSSGSSGTAALSVSTPTPLPVASVSVSFNSQSLVVGQATQAVAIARDANGNVIAGKTVVWSSDDAPLAAITANGLVSALASGSATIIAKVDGVIGFATIQIGAPTPLPVATVQLSLSPGTINTGQKSTSSVVLRDSLGTILSGRTIGWSSNKPTVASVGLGGVVTGVGAGSATITAASEGKSGGAPLTVNSVSLPTVATVTVSATLNSLTPGQSTQATAVARDASGNVMAGQTVTWISSNAAAATVSATGLVTAMAVGATTVTATAGGKSGSLAITVALPATASVSVTAPTMSLTVGQTTQATAVVKDAAGNAIAGASAFWSSSSATVATVSQSGVISAVAAGSANITASNSGKSGSVTITVVAGPPPPPPPPTGAVPSIPPTLPQATVDVSWKSSTRTLTVNAGGNLQAALDSAKRGDEIVLAAGATFTGNFELPPKAGNAANGWITVRSSALSQLPALGSRIDPALHASLMPKIVTANVLPALATRYNTVPTGWRLVGLEITVAPGAGLAPNIQQGIVVIGTDGSTQASLAQTPRDYILDRVYIHGQSNTNTKRCLAANGASIAVIGSHLLECHGKGFDAQAIGEWNGPGPFLVENNHLEASAEVIMFGGSIASIPNLVASDITIRRNFLTRPMSWKGVWTVKNLFELKNAQRVLFEQNVLENHWVDAQAGSSIVLGTADNPCSWCIVSDVTFQWNHIHNVSGGFNLFPRYGNAQPMRRVKIAQNLITGLGASGLGSNGRFLTVQDNVDDVWFESNTGMGVATYVDITGSVKKARFTFRNNVGGGATYNWFSSQGSGDAANNANLAAPFLVANNGFVANATALIPSGSLRVTSLSAVGFANPIWPNGNWTLGGTSSFAGLGVDYTQLQAKLVNVR